MAQEKTGAVASVGSSYRETSRGGSCFAVVLQIFALLQFSRFY